MLVWLVGQFGVAAAFVRGLDPSQSRVSASQADGETELKLIGCSRESIRTLRRIKKYKISDDDLNKVRAFAVSSQRRYLDWQRPKPYRVNPLFVTSLH